MTTLPVVFTRRATTQLRDLESYLAGRFHPASAAGYVERLRQSCIGIGQTPYIGRPYPVPRPGVRSIGFERTASIFYVLHHQEVRILGIFYRGRTPDLSL